MALWFSCYLFWDMWVNLMKWLKFVSLWQKTPAGKLVVALEQERNLDRDDFYLRKKEVLFLFLVVLLYNNLIIQSFKELLAFLVIVCSFYKEQWYCAINFLVSKLIWFLKYWYSNKNRVTLIKNCEHFGVKT